MTQQNKAKISYIFALFLYGTMGVVLKYINLPIEFVVLIRGIVGSLFLLILTLITRGKLDTQSIKKNFKYLFLSGMSLGINWVCLFGAFRVSTVSISILVDYMAPVFMIIVSPLLFKEHLNPKKLICVFIAFIGLIMVSGVVGSDISMINVRGLLLAAGAGLGFMGLIIFNKLMGKVSVYDKAVVQISISALTVVPFAIKVGLETVVVWDFKSVFLSFMMGLVSTGIAYYFYFYGISGLSVQTVAVVGYVEPVITVLASVLFLKEPMSMLAMIGAVLIIGAAVSSEFMSGRSTDEKELKSSMT